METLFLILSGAILFAGVVYWLWSHIQLTQKKVQLLENAVFELRAMIPPGGGTAGPPQSVSVVTGSGSGSGPTPTPVAKTYTDLGDDDWEDSPAVTAEVPAVSTPLEEIHPNPPSTMPTLITREAEMGVMDMDLDAVSMERGHAGDELMPGGRISLGPDSDVAASPSPKREETDADQFKQLFAEPRPALEGMPLKELRRLGEQRGIVGAAEMRKKELLAALRQQVTAPAPAPVEESATKELDLDAVEAEEAEMLE
jgi:hypothetical protein